MRTANCSARRLDDGKRSRRPGGDGPDPERRGRRNARDVNAGPTVCGQDGIAGWQNRTRMSGSEKKRQRERPAEPGPAAGEVKSFAGELERRSGLRQASFAVPAADVKPIVEAKRRFGPLAVARFVGAVLKELTRLLRCQRADHK